MQRPWAVSLPGGRETGLTPWSKSTPQHQGSETMSRKKRATENPETDNPLKGEDRGKRLATLERHGKTVKSKEDEVRAWVELLVDWEEKSERGGAFLNRRKNRRRFRFKVRKR